MLLNKTYCINVPLNSAFLKERFDIKYHPISAYKQTEKTILHSVLIFHIT